MTKHYLALLFTAALAFTSVHAQSGLVPPNQVIAGPSSGGSSAFAKPRALVGADLPAPSASTLGGVQSYVAVTHQWINSISIGGAPSSTQPAFSDVAGNIAVSQFNSGTGASASTYWNGTGTWTQPVTSVTCGTGLSGGTITTTGTCAASLSSLTNSLGADVLLNNTANYFGGPSIAQGSVGTWFVTGTVTVEDTSGAAQIFCKLWDGTTVIASADVFSSVATAPIPVALSGVITSPVGNLQISCRDISSTSGRILFNTTSNSKDSTLTGIRIN